jgi:hypothetical protein
MAGALSGQGPASSGVGTLGPVASFSTSAMSFTEARRSGLRVGQDLIVRNTGDAPLSVTGWKIYPATTNSSPGFPFAAYPSFTHDVRLNGTTVTVAGGKEIHHPGQKLAISVIFDPSISGCWQGWLEVATTVGSWLVRLSGETMFDGVGGCICSTIQPGVRQISINCEFSKFCRTFSLNSVAPESRPLYDGAVPVVHRSPLGEARGGCSGCSIDMPFRSCCAPA